MRGSKNRYFYHILISPGDAPGAITLNVVWMEREFDAYKLSRCMCPPNYNRFWDTARCWSKIVNFFIPPCIRRPRLGGSRWNSAAPFGVEKLEWLGYHTVKKFEDIFIRFGATHERDRQTDRHRMPAIAIDRLNLIIQVYTSLKHVTILHCLLTTAIYKIGLRYSIIFLIQ